ncbi:thioredoxin domain-containing protein [Flavobacteriaceae bacterium TP-CH-4]|uniref:Thioredoxin domain-containing protein n=1 Tax=Pelagihabitans pacificus TaxID=2696054 RepID=A0A967ASI4_9FLAO|nr:thioredoxin domain-containing protein [Pelagihabitans pacificus]NHF59556.1 thioredoxin domain-containing protein [Pelagihabitans pacificus]
MHPIRFRSRKLLVLSFLVVLMSCQEKDVKQKGEKQGVRHQYTNALAEETSPYLLQHAHNPVDWRPWSEAALQEAEKENKLVLVSIGYSSCHWCHVMEEETFEDEEVAKIMNQNFINIKVDREERPDIDQVYMTALQLMNGTGGWPLNVITLPNGKPLYGGTYHTKDQWTQVLTKINELYHNDPAKAAEYSDMVAEGIAQANLVQPTSGFETLTTEVLRKSVANWRSFWDFEQGGDRGPQKFMLPSNLDFLLDYAILSDDDAAKAHVKNTLDKIVNGGIYDHIGGGLYRYSTDAQWKVPHFEKMLYDNAQAISLFSEAYAVFKEPAYKELVLETIAFLEREMKDKDGGYQAAIDADSEGEEGKFYLWDDAELKSVLGATYELFAAYYTIRPDTVWEDGNFVLHRSTSDKAFAREHDLSIEALGEAKKEWKKKLLEVRNKRVRPNSDDKIITSWNALLINAFVDAYKAFGQPEHLEKAKNVFTFLKKNNYKDGALVHSYKEGSKMREGFLEDYAFLIDASLQLYTAVYDRSYLDFAELLTQEVMEKFGDPSGMFRYNSDDDLIAKIIKTDDGVLPSPNAVMAHNLFRLGHILYDTDMVDASKGMLASMTESITEGAPSYARWAKLLMHHTAPFYEVAVVGRDAGELVAQLNKTHLPNTLVVATTVESELPLFKGRYAEEGTYIFVCQDTSCKLPVDTAEKAIGQIRNF